jgi:hypothetical protein
MYIYIYILIKLYYNHILLHYIYYIILYYIILYYIILYYVILYYIIFLFMNSIVQVPLTSPINACLFILTLSPTHRAILLQVARGVGPKQLQLKATPSPSHTITHSFSFSLFAFLRPN